MAMHVRPDGTQILIGEATHRLANGSVITREVDKIAVYGREEGLSVYELVGFSDDELTAEGANSWIARYEQGLGRYRNRDLSGAIRDFVAVLRERRHDGPAEVTLDRCKQYSQTGSSETWQPIAALKSK